MTLPGDRWIWVTIGAAIAVAALVLVLAYTPYGHWKLALVAAAFTVALVIGLNPDIRLLVLGTSSVFAGLAGLSSTVLFSFSVRLPDGSTGQVGVEAGTPVEGWIYLALIISGLVAVGAHTVFQRQAATGQIEALSDADTLTYVAHTAQVRAQSPRNDEEPVRFRIMMSVSKSFSRQVRIVRSDIDGALSTEVLVSNGDGLFADNLVTKKSGCEVRIDARFSAELAKELPFQKEVRLVDDRGTVSDPIQITFQA